MQFSTRFNLNEVVYGITQQSRPDTTPACEVCEGSGYVKVFIIKHGDAEYPCPNKRGDGNNHRPIVVTVKTLWEVEKPQHVIKVRVQHEEALAPEFKPFHKNSVDYALHPDKYNSHKVWQEDNLFSTEEHAQAVCDTRNKETA